jgi:hypothetical protein
VTLDAEPDMEGLALGSVTDENDPEQQYRVLYDGNFAAVLGYILRWGVLAGRAVPPVDERGRALLDGWRATSYPTRLPESPSGTGSGGCC